jgi:5-methylcytosine-specific restriction protein A
MRLGQEPKDIMGSGWATSAPTEGDHYSGEPGEKQFFIDLKWDTLLDPSSETILEVPELKDRIPEVNWFPQSSGIIIPPKAMQNSNRCGSSI